MVLLEGGNSASNKTVKGEDEDDAADDAVDEPHGADVEVAAHFIDKEGDDRPPYQSAHHNERVTKDDMVELIFRQGETESSE